MLTTSPENATPSPTTHEVATPDRRPILFLISALVIALDRLTKIWIVDHIRPGYSIPVIPGVFRLSHVLNTGAAFSMMENWRADYVRIGLVSFSAVAAVLVFVLLWRVGRALSLFDSCDEFAGPKCVERDGARSARQWARGTVADRCPHPSRCA